jgi:hypothetical protein
MAFKPKAELMFEEKFEAALKNQDFELVQTVLNQYGCYLELIKPLPESYGLPVSLCADHEVPFMLSDPDFVWQHSWEDDEGTKMWCDFPKPLTAGESIDPAHYSFKSILDRVNADIAKALES